MPRLIKVIAAEIGQNWEKPYFAAVPYLAAMLRLSTLDDKYGAEDADDIVLRFIANASTWRGMVARQIKQELRDMLRTWYNTRRNKSEVS